ncbi:hypothetical protein AHF37_06168 [Paragonimus kellicotti]|nr:hypothetical protein AHF37_06168 [Paragonimus kellicotti]
MKSTMTDDLAASINWRGVNSRFSLASTLFASALVETVMKHQFVGVSHAVVKERYNVGYRMPRERFQRTEEKRKMRKTNESSYIVQFLTLFRMQSWMNLHFLKQL